MPGQENAGGGVAKTKDGARMRARGVLLIVVLIALGPLVGGCDKCGDWFGISRSVSGGALQSCRDTGPQQH